jgi:hypothetical protein
MCLEVMELDHARRSLGAEDEIARLELGAAGLERFRWRFADWDGFGDGLQHR